MNAYGRRPIFILCVLQVNCMMILDNLVSCQHEKHIFNMSKARFCL